MKSYTELKLFLTESKSRYETEYLTKLSKVDSGKSKSETVKLINGYSVRIVPNISTILHNGKLISPIETGGGLWDDGYQLSKVRPFSEYEKIQNFDDFDQLVKMITLGKTRQQIKWNKL